MSTTVSLESVRPALFEELHQQHKDALKMVREFAQRVADGGTPSCLSLLGRCGAGKTMLAENLILKLKNEFKRKTRTVIWPRQVGLFTGGIAGRPNHAKWLESMQAPTVLLIDDFRKESHDTNSNHISRARMYEVLQARARSKFTIITSNWSLPMIAEFEQAIASRMIRNDGLIATMDQCPDYFAK